MKWVFWGTTTLIVYTFVGYPAWLWLRGQLRPRPVNRGAHQPTVSIVMVVRDEAAVLESKLRNLLAINYPTDSSEIVVVSDGSVDATNEILSLHAKNERVRVILSAEARGKAASLNDAIEVSRGEIIVFTDARQNLEPDAVRFLLENFGDSNVGCVSGELMLGEPDWGEDGRAPGLYWRYEKRIRELEARSGSVVGATGALYAVRRELLVPLPAETILDDVYLPMEVARQGFRIVFETRARAWDSADLGAGREFARKVRTLTGNYQLLRLAPWLLSDANPLRFEFLSHKMLRLAMPAALAGALLSTMWLPQTIYRAALISQVAFYGLSLAGLLRLKGGFSARLADAAFTFVMLNTAAVVAFASFAGRRPVVWNPPLTEPKTILER